MDPDTGGQLITGLVGLLSGSILAIFVAIGKKLFSYAAKLVKFILNALKSVKLKR
jgi:hypothetical protein